MVMTAAVLLALYAVFDASVRVFGAARDRAEAAQAARLGLARMEREIRAAYPRDRAGGDATLLTSFGEDRLDFGNDLNGNRRTVDPATGIAEPGEGISYTLGSGGAPLRNGRLLVELRRGHRRRRQGAHLRVLRRQRGPGGDGRRSGRRPGARGARGLGGDRRPEEIPSSASSGRASP